MNISPFPGLGHWEVPPAPSIRGLDLSPQTMKHKVEKDFEEGELVMPEQEKRVGGTNCQQSKSPCVMGRAHAGNRGSGSRNSHPKDPD